VYPLGGKREKSQPEGDVSDWLFAWGMGYFLKTPVLSNVETAVSQYQQHAGR